MSPHRNNGRRGQALVETALVAPLIFLLALGAYDVSIFASNQVAAQTAVRNAARSGALEGGKGGGNQNTCKGAIPSSGPTAFNPADTDGDNDGDQDAIDESIVQAVIRGTANMSYATITEIDVYQPNQASGVWQASANQDKYDATGAELKTGGVDTQTFNLTSMRCQGPLGSESDLGVRIVWNYKPVNRIIGLNINGLSDWAVEKLAFCDTGCHQ